MTKIYCLEIPTQRHECLARNDILLEIATAYCVCFAMTYSMLRYTEMRVEDNPSTAIAVPLPLHRDGFLVAHRHLDSIALFVQSSFIVWLAPYLRPVVNLRRVAIAPCADLVVLSKV